MAPAAAGSTQSAAGLVEVSVDPCHTGPALPYAAASSLPLGSVPPCRCLEEVVVAATPQGQAQAATHGPCAGCRAGPCLAGAVASQASHCVDIAVGARYVTAARSCHARPGCALCASLWTKPFGSACPVLTCHLAALSKPGAAPAEEAVQVVRFVGHTGCFAGCPTGPCPVGGVASSAWLALSLVADAGRKAGWAHGPGVRSYPGSRRALGTALEGLAPAPPAV